MGRYVSAHCMLIFILGYKRLVIPDDLWKTAGHPSREIIHLPFQQTEFRAILLLTFRDATGGLKKITYPAPPSNLILCTSVHVAGLQERRCLSIGGTDGIRHHTGPRGIMGDTLHPANLRASATAHWAGVPFTGTPAEEVEVGRGQ